MEFLMVVPRSLPELVEISSLVVGFVVDIWYIYTVNRLYKPTNYRWEEPPCNQSIDFSYSYSNFSDDFEVSILQDDHLLVISREKSPFWVGKPAKWAIGVRSVKFLGGSRVTHLVSSMCTFHVAKTGKSMDIAEIWRIPSVLQVSAPGRCNKQNWRFSCWRMASPVRCRWPWLGAPRTICGPGKPQSF